MSWSALLEPTQDRVLDSGLRVVVAHRPGARFAVVLSQLRGGSRADPVGAAGTAHLTEHLLARGWAVGGQRWTASVLAAGGELTGTTHPDYLEFCTETPYEALPTALRAERARLVSWPSLGQDEFARQQVGVLQEIVDHCAARPTRSLPWPALGPRVFDTWADSHDPFGNARHVEALTEADCRRFFDQHHGPGRAVVVVLADLARVPGGAESIYEALEMPARVRPAPEPVADPGPWPTSGICVLDTWTAPHSVGAVGWRVPSVVADPQRYAALLAVAAQLGRRPGSRARLGQMTPMDRAAGDVLTLTVLDPVDAGPVLERAMSDPLEDLHHDPAEVSAAIRRARTSTAGTLDRPRSRAQLLARAVTLTGDPLTAGRWVDAVRTLGHEEVLTAARALSDAPVTGLVGLPSSPTARTTSTPSRPRPRPSVPTRPADPRRRRVRTLALDRPYLAAAVAVRLAPSLGTDAVTRLRAQGYQLTEDRLGWLLQHHRYGRADDLAASVWGDLHGRDDGEGTDVRHLVLVGEGASQTGPLLTVQAGPGPGHSRARDEEESGHLAVRVRPDLPHDTASAELRWAVESRDFVPRWVGVALLVGIHTRDADGQVDPMDAPPGTFIGIRQEPTLRGPELVAEVYAPALRLPEALEHLAAELSRPRLQDRCSRIATAVALLEAGWHRDAAHPPSWARHASVVLDLGGTGDDAREFGPRLRGVCADAVVARILQDTSTAPRGSITTSRPEVLCEAGLPWRLASARQVTAVS